MTTQWVIPLWRRRSAGTTLFVIRRCRAADISPRSSSPISSSRTFAKASAPLAEHHREGQDERSTTPIGGLHGDGPAVRLHDALADAEAQSIAPSALGPRAINAKEGLEHVLAIAFGDARAVVRDADHDHVLVLDREQFDGRAPRQGILRGVFDTD